MSFSNKAVKYSRYIIQVKGHIDFHMEKWFEGMRITPSENNVTILSGEVIDQSALYGLLEIIHSLNLTLISIQQIDSEEESTK